MRCGVGDAKKAARDAWSAGLSHCRGVQPGKCAWNQNYSHLKK
jgi:hypothetical protein